MMVSISLALMGKHTLKVWTDMAGINLEGRAKLVVEEERIRVVKTLGDILRGAAMEDMARQSAEEVKQIREEMGITQSLGAEPRMVDVTDTEMGKLSSPEPLFEMAEQIREPSFEQTEMSDPRRATSPRPVLRPESMETPTQQVSDGAKGLLDFIGEGEGGYDSANRGTDSKGDIVGSQLVAERNGKKVSEMTIKEIREYQQITDPNNENRLFTVGKYQTVPETFEQAVDALDLSPDTVFSPEVQDQVGLFLVGQKRPRLGKFLQGDESISVERAMLSLAMEFASIPVPYDISKGSFGSWPKTDLVAGDSFYKQPSAAKGNKALHTVEETKEKLNSARQ
jgi:DNA-binding transcriptional regulator YiaG